MRALWLAKSKKMCLEGLRVASGKMTLEGSREAHRYRGSRYFPQQRRFLQATNNIDFILEPRQDRAAKQKIEEESSVLMRSRGGADGVNLSDHKLCRESR